MTDSEVPQTDLYKAIDDLVRHHDSREPYLTNTVERIYMLVQSGLPPERINRDDEYRRGYRAGHAAKTRKKKL